MCKTDNQSSASFLSDDPGKQNFMNDNRVEHTIGQEKDTNSFNKNIMDRGISSETGTVNDICNCSDYNTSGADIPPRKSYFLENHEIIICWYDSIVIRDTIITGKLLPDSSFFVNGFNIYDCRDEPISLFESGEYHIHRIIFEENKLSISRYVSLPVLTNWEYRFTPIVSYQIKLFDENFIIDTVFALDYSEIKMSDISNFDKRNENLKKRAYTEYPFESNEDYVYQFFIATLFDSDRYRDEFLKISELNDYMHVEYQFLLDYLSVYENSDNQ